jgi:L-threonine kinase
MHPGVVAFDHRRVCLRARLGWLPALTIIGLDEGGVVDTVAFNRRAKPFTAADRARYADLLHAMGSAVARQDVRRVGALATVSAEMNQQLCPKRALDDLRRVCRDIGGLGVVTAHSGTMVGILLSPDDPDYRRRMADGLRACAELAGTVSLFRTLPFG